MNHDYPLVICYKAMNNGPVEIVDVFPVQMLPEAYFNPNHQLL